jgi:hypothetical protein
MIQRVRPVPPRKLRSNCGSRRTRIEPIWAVAISSARSAQQRLASGLTSMAQAQHFLGRFEPARGNFGEALGLALEANDLASVTVALGPLSNLEGAAGDHDRAVRLWAACEAIKQRIGGGAPAQVMRVSDPSAAASLAIGEDAVARAWAQGWAMTPQEAVRYAARCRSVADRTVAAGVSGEAYVSTCQRQGRHPSSPHGVTRPERILRPDARRQPRKHRFAQR